MEYVAEGELFELILKKKRLKEPEACEFFKQLLNGVEHLHEIGIVHRDLKPENLLIDFGRTLKIVDFGLSNTYKQRTYFFIQEKHSRLLVGHHATQLPK
jgi:5'-AMP-activated protein kinase, catalytic alpha subunit